MNNIVTPLLATIAIYIQKRLVFFPPKVHSAPASLERGPSTTLHLREVIIVDRHTPHLYKCPLHRDIGRLTVPLCWLRKFKDCNDVDEDNKRGHEVLREVEQNKAMIGSNEIYKDLAGSLSSIWFDWSLRIRRCQRWRWRKRSSASICI